MWHPNKAQWWVMWIVAILLSFLILITMGRLDDEAAAVRLGIVVILFGTLLVWPFSKRQ
jgi:hypothetical protein